MNKEIVEEAAKEYVGEIEDIVDMAGYNGFIKGAKWHEKQSISVDKALDSVEKAIDLAHDKWSNNSATEAVEFFKWVNKHYKEHGSHYEDDVKISSYIHKSLGGVPLRIEKLYDLYKQSML